ncbi:MAG: hypothetical protein P4L74_05910 [Candidatus Doudnabacteria bacterium]|nr:hypothetical protein [Candidatus Doudnabacteria bacterium]
MQDITLQSIKQAFREEIKPLDSKLNSLDGKADRTSVIVANLVEDFHEVPTILKQIRDTQGAHGNVLDEISKNTKD